MRILTNFVVLALFSIFLPLTDSFAQVENDDNQIPEVTVSLSQEEKPELHFTLGVSYLRNELTSRFAQRLSIRLHHFSQLILKRFHNTSPNEKNIIRFTKTTAYEPELRLPCSEVRFRFNKSISLLDKVTRHLKTMDRHLERDKTERAEKSLHLAEKYLNQIEDIFPEYLDEKVYYSTFTWDLYPGLFPALSSRKKYKSPHKQAVSNIQWNRHSFTHENFPFEFDEDWNDFIYSLTMKQSLTNICLDNSLLIIKGKYSTTRKETVYCDEKCGAKELDYAFKLYP